MGSKIKAKAISLYRIQNDEKDVDVRDEADSVSSLIRRGGGNGEMGSGSDGSSDPESLSSSRGSPNQTSMPRIPAGCLSCAWCQKVELAREFSFKTPNGQKVFCSEQCFTQCRRASFKRNKTCDWCRHVRHTVNYVDFQDGDHQLQFCSDKCLNQYKMNIFCKETQAHLELHSEMKTGDDTKCETGVSGALITPEMWMRDCRSESPDSESATPPRIPSPVIEIKISRSPSPEKTPRIPRKKISRMKRSCRDGGWTLRRNERALIQNLRIADAKRLRYPQLNSIPLPRPLPEPSRILNASIRKPIPSPVTPIGIPPPLLPIHRPMPPLLPNILPPPTTIVPYPIFIPVPVPLPIPIPIPLKFPAEVPQNDKTTSNPPRETNNNHLQASPPLENDAKASVTLRRRKRLLGEAIQDSDASSKPKIVHV